MAHIHVPQKDGSIVIASNGDEPVTRNVSDHTVTVAERDVEHFLGAVEGSRLAPDTGAKAKE